MASWNMARVALGMAALIGTGGCTSSHARAPGIVAAGTIAMGEASYYGSEIAGSRTASGERCDPDDLTAAHRTLPFGARIRVTDVDSGRSVVVRINDRGPWRGKRIIDLSRAAAQKIGLVQRGRGQVALSMAN